MSRSSKRKPHPSATPRPEFPVPVTGERDTLTAETRRRDNIRAEFYAAAGDAHYAARRVVAGDPVLSARFESYAANGGSPLDLREVPAYRRAAAVEAAIDKFEAGRSERPCDACGSFSFRWPSGGETRLDLHATPPPHVTRPVALDPETPHVRTDLLLCGWCDGEHAWRVGGIVGTLHAVLAAASGYRGTSSNHRARFAFESPHLNTGKPWGHLRRAGVLGIATAQLRAGEWVRSRLVTTQQQAGLLAAQFPGITPIVWNPERLPALNPLPDVPNVYPEWVVKEQKEAAERVRLSAVHDAEYKAEEAAGIARLNKFKAKHPVPVGPSGEVIGYLEGTSEADEWQRLLNENRRALSAIDNKFKVSRFIYRPDR